MIFSLFFFPVFDKRFAAAYTFYCTDLLQYLLTLSQGKGFSRFTVCQKIQYFIDPGEPWLIKTLCKVGKTAFCEANTFNEMKL